jgi:hypothetical protein
MNLRQTCLIGLGVILGLAAQAQPAISMGSSGGAPNELNCQGRVGSYCYVRMPDTTNPSGEGTCYRVKVLSEMDSAISQVSAQFCDSQAN